MCSRGQARPLAPRASLHAPRSSCATAAAPSLKAAAPLSLPLPRHTPLPWSPPAQVALQGKDASLRISGPRKGPRPSRPPSVDRLSGDRHPSGCCAPQSLHSDLRHARCVTLLPGPCPRAKEERPTVAQTACPPRAVFAFIPRREQGPLATPPLMHATANAKTNTTSRCAGSQRGERCLRKTTQEGSLLRYGGADWRHARVAHTVREGERGRERAGGSAARSSWRCRRLALQQDPKKGAAAAADERSFSRHTCENENERGGCGSRSSREAAGRRGRVRASSAGCCRGRRAAPHAPGAAAHAPAPARPLSRESTVRGRKGCSRRHRRKRRVGQRWQQLGTEESAGGPWQEGNPRSNSTKAGVPAGATHF